MNVAIVKYNAGNVQSVLHALARLGVEAVWTDDPAQLRAADKVIFPGVGEAASAMRYLQNKKLTKVIADLTQPVLGICLGLQLFCSHSEEGDTACLGIFENKVRKFQARSGIKIPHMGWSALSVMQGPLFEGLEAGSSCYFVHSYYAEPSADTCAICCYDIDFSAALQHRNFYAVQFHPEKSGPIGSRILRNFLNL